MGASAGNYRTKSSLNGIYDTEKFLFAYTKFARSLVLIVLCL
jgi:hypothetical protein